MNKPTKKLALYTLFTLFAFGASVQADTASDALNSISKYTLCYTRRTAITLLPLAGIGLTHAMGHCINNSQPVTNTIPSEFVPATISLSSPIHKQSFSIIQKVRTILHGYTTQTLMALTTHQQIGLGIAAACFAGLAGYSIYRLWIKPKTTCFQTKTDSDSKSDYARAATIFVTQEGNQYTDLCLEGLSVLEKYDDLLFSEKFKCHFLIAYYLHYGKDNKDLEKRLQNLQNKMKNRGYDAVIQQETTLLGKIIKAEELDCETIK